MKFDLDRLTSAFARPEERPLSFEELLDVELKQIDVLRVRRGVRASAKVDDERAEPLAGPPGAEPPGEPGADNDAPPLEQGEAPAAAGWRRAAVARAHRRRLVGLAFSGGGIRSATFNLGILQALAQLGLLRHFDYLSTVSGGGYIGSWLTAWIKRRGLETVAAELIAEHPPTPDKVPEADGDGRPAAALPRRPVAPIQFLRRYSNYLTPETGFFSLDTWMAAATYLRNLVLNLNVLVLALAAVLLVPRLFVALVFGANRYWGAPAWNLLLLGAMAALAALVAAGIASNMQLLSGAERRQPAHHNIFLAVVLPTLVLSLLFVLWLFGEERSDSPWTWIKLGAAAYLGFWLLVMVLWLGLRRGELPGGDQARLRLAGLIGGALLSAAVAGAGTSWLLWLLVRERAPGQLGPENWLRIITWAPPGIMVVLILAGVYFIGLMGRSLPEEERQWWSRLGGWMGLLALGWLGLFVVAFYAPPVLAWLRGEAPVVSGSVSLGWLLATAAGVIVGRSPSTQGTPGGGGRQKLLELGAKVAPYVFVAGLVMLLALATDRLLLRLDCRARPAPAAATEFAGAVRWGAFSAEQASALRSPSRACGLSLPLASAARIEARGAFRRLAERRDAELDRAAWRVFERRDTVAYLALALALGAWLLSWRVDINEFSMHNFYRDRLTRPYLGATRKRKPNPFTGFDSNDDLRLDKLLAGPSEREREERREIEREERELLRAQGKTPPERSWNGLFDGPYPILNTTLNLTGGSGDLAWQERQANSFVFTPLGYGFEPGEQEKLAGVTRGYRFSGKAGSWRLSKGREGISLATAMTVSGAAVNPAMGYHSSPALAFLLTVFNARLGLWMGNPASESTWHLTAPTLALEALLSELFSNTGADSRWVNLSDGGFFDNLGVYELVRRRCRFILATDVEGDPDLELGALGSVIRRCRSDFGIEIRFENLQPLARQADSGFSRWHCAVGTIHYDRVDRGAPKGILVYVKSTLTGDEPADLLNYHRRHPGFPHESTADQWFDESQFESYRRLGQHIGLVMFRAIGLQPGV